MVPRDTAFTRIPRRAYSNCERFGRGIRATLRQRRQRGRYTSDCMVDEARGDLHDMGATLPLHLCDG